MKFLSLLCFTILFSFVGLGQTIELPNFALATHPMMVERIDLSDSLITIELSIENQLAEGSFCADKNIYIKDIRAGRTYRLLGSSGIPVCPEQHHFNTVGEKLNFQLFFPPLEAGTKYINIVEDCEAYCFTIYGLIMDTAINRTINEGYVYFDKGDYVKALEAFKKVVDENTDYPFGHLTYNLIMVQAKLNHMEEAKQGYETIKASSFADKSFVLDKLKKEPFFFKLEEK